MSATPKVLSYTAVTRPERPLLHRKSRSSRAIIAACRVAIHVQAPDFSIVIVSDAKVNTTGSPTDDCPIKVVAVQPAKHSHAVSD
jgi:hypothetical protein